MVTVWSPKEPYCISIAWACTLKVKELYSAVSETIIAEDRFVIVVRKKR